jgi:hypothetical protein
MKVANTFFENVSKFEYLRTAVTNRNCIHEENKSRLNQGMLATMQFRIFCLPVCYVKS